jgi:hypothetical protein
VVPEFSHSLDQSGPSVSHREGPSGTNSGLPMTELQMARFDPKQAFLVDPGREEMRHRALVSGLLMGVIVAATWKLRPRRI